MLLFLLAILDSSHPSGVEDPIVRLTTISTTAKVKLRSMVSLAIDKET
jgi:hypothetical protein